MDVVIFIAALSVLVLAHELGHFLAAKLLGVGVEEFGLGLPPRIFGKKIGSTIFSLNWLPIGGFCRLYGEDPAAAESVEGKKGTFINKKPGEKFLVVVGGVVMNLVLAVTIFSLVYAKLGLPVETERVKIVEVVVGSPAARAKVGIGDWIKKVNGVEVSAPEQLTAEVEKKKGTEIVLTIEREGKEQEVKVEARENPPEGEGSMGVAISNIEMEKIKWYQFYKGIGAGFREAYYWGKIIYGGMAEMIKGLIAGRVPKDIAGPLGIYEATSNINKSQGILAVVHFFGIISVNLAVVNILPFPALDGGRIGFVLYELVTGKKAKKELESAVNSVGMAVLLALIALITLADVRRMFFK